MILDYLLFIIKFLIFCGAVAIPVTFVCGLLEKEYNILFKKNKNHILDLFILIYFVLLIFLLIIYFVPLIIYGIDTSFLEIIINILKLIVVNILFSAIVLVFAIITTAIYEKINKNKKKNKLNIFSLWKSISLCLIIIFIIYLIFPNILPLILYLIY